ncbi:hypothetical protein AB433_08065 [Croceicoccus naphthovorans]|uniref:Uncharacterized protein n=1 Tax=Croceicoccus naphthovorans TaxID=1348774 RepID=A0A0G3XJC2_9SPHN|nr:hypothetical protein AB433_08065 [Croceicoccus naphthovorans]
MNSTEQVSVLAATTGLILIAFYFLALYLGADTADWLPDVIACIAGFELYMFGQAHWEAFKRKRARNGGDPRG